MSELNEYDFLKDDDHTLLVTIARKVVKMEQNLNKLPCAQHSEDIAVIKATCNERHDGSGNSKQNFKVKNLTWLGMPPSFALAVGILGAFAGWWK